MFCGCDSSLTESALSPQASLIILDPGHGGADGGAVAADGSKESELNLSVALKAEMLLCFLGRECIMTRSSELIDYPDSAKTIRAKKIADQKARVKLINSYPSAVLISIHQNIYPSLSPKGAQALYGSTDGSSEFAELLQGYAALALGQDKNRGTAQISEDIYLMKMAECPAVLFECGFMSNPDELAQLKDEEYQKKLAAIIAAAGTQYTSETGNSYG